MAFIYKITNDVNGKVYIGKTSLESVEERFKAHIKDSNRTRRQTEHRPLYRAMKKYGVEHFHVELIEVTDKPEEREQYYIELYDSYHNGYNATLGGDGKPYHFVSKEDIDKLCELYESGLNGKELAKVFGCHPETVIRKLKELNYHIKTHTEQTSVSVVQMDKKGNVIRVFKSLREATKSLGEKEKQKRRHIVQVCKGERRTAYGYIWKFEHDLTSEESKSIIISAKALEGKLT